MRRFIPSSHFSTFKTPISGRAVWISASMIDATDP